MSPRVFPGNNNTFRPGELKRKSGPRCPHSTGPLAILSVQTTNLPALKSLGELAGLRPVIEIDSREQFPLAFTVLSSIRDVTLPEGDYAIAGVDDWIVERKGSLNELAACCMGSNRHRFERELKRLLPYRFKRLLIVGARDEQDVLKFHYHSRILPKCVLALLYGWQARFDLPYVLCSTPVEAARRIELWAHYWCKHKVDVANHLLRGCRSENHERPVGAAPEILSLIPVGLSAKGSTSATGLGEGSLGPFRLDAAIRNDETRDLMNDIKKAMAQYEKALGRASGRSRPEHLDEVIEGVNEAHKKVLEALQNLKKELSRTQDERL
jgi:hypothetical protein